MSDTSTIEIVSVTYGDNLNRGFFYPWDIYNNDINTDAYGRRDRTANKDCNSVNYSEFNPSYLPTTFEGVCNGKTECELEGPGDSIYGSHTGCFGLFEVYYKCTNDFTGGTEYAAMWDSHRTESGVQKHGTGGRSNWYNTEYGNNFHMWGYYPNPTPKLKLSCLPVIETNLKNQAKPYDEVKDEMALPCPHGFTQFMYPGGDKSFLTLNKDVPCNPESIGCVRVKGDDALYDANFDTFLPMKSSTWTTVPSTPGHLANCLNPDYFEVTKKYNEKATQIKYKKNPICSPYIVEGLECECQEGFTPGYDEEGYATCVTSSMSSVCTDENLTTSCPASQAIIDGESLTCKI